MNPFNIVIAPTPMPSQPTKIEVKENLERQLLWFIGIMVVLMTAVAAFAIRNTIESRASSDWVNHTHAVILEIDSIYNALIKAEARLRDYLITSNPQLKNDYEVEIAEVDEHLAVARVMTDQTSSQTRRLAELERLIHQQVEFFRNTIRTHDAEGFDKVRPHFASNSHRDRLNQIRTLIAAMIEEENARLQTRDQENLKNARSTRFIVFAGLLVNFILLGALFLLVRADLRVRRKAAGILKETNASLEARVHERTKELEEAVDSLKSENLERRWAQQSAEKLSHYSDLVVNAIQEAIFVVSTRGNIIRTNEGGARLVQRKASELSNKPLSAILPRLQDTQTTGDVWEADPIRQCMKTQQAVFRAPAEIRRKDGRTLNVSCSCSPLIEQGLVTGAVLMMVPQKD